MKIKIDKFGDYVLEIPSDVIEAMGWKVGDNLTIDIPMTQKDVLVIHRKDGPK